jgi:hypothetical protein
MYPSIGGNIFFLPPELDNFRKKEHEDAQWLRICLYWERRVV